MLSYEEKIYAVYMQGFPSQNQVECSLHRLVGKQLQY